MEIAVVGARADDLCQAAAVGAQPFSSLASVAGHMWDLLALTPDVAHGEICRGDLRAKTLLLPGDSAPSFALSLHALQLVGYGLSPRDTLTLSSLAGTERLLCLQRSLLTPDGVLLEPQEAPLPAALSTLDEERALLVAGLRLLCGTL